MAIQVVCDRCNNPIEEKEHAVVFFDKWDSIKEYAENKTPLYSILFEGNETRICVVCDTCYEAMNQVADNYPCQLIPFDYILPFDYDSDMEKIESDMHLAPDAYLKRYMPDVSFDGMLIVEKVNMVNKHLIQRIKNLMDRVAAKTATSVYKHYDSKYSQYKDSNLSKGTRYAKLFGDPRRAVCTLTRYAGSSCAVNTCVLSGMCDGPYNWKDETLDLPMCLLNHSDKLLDWLMEEDPDVSTTNPDHPRKDAK